MLKLLAWLTDVAWKKPRVLGIMLLILGLLVFGRVVIYQQGQLEAERKTNREQTKECNERVDSLIRYYRLKEDKLNDETKATLNAMIEDYKKQLQQQRDLNHKVDNSIIENDKVIKRNKIKLKTLTDVN